MYSCIYNSSKDCDGCHECIYGNQEPEICPSCGEKNFMIKYTKDDETLGCDNCVSSVNDTYVDADGDECALIIYYRDGVKIGDEDSVFEVWV